MIRRLLTRCVRPRRRGAGQSLVEFTLVLPIVLTLVMGAAEMGMAIGNNMSLELATREGARVGASLCAGSATTPWDKVDPQIIASVERALRSPGSPIDVTKIDYIHIFRANADGSEGVKNVWTYAPGSGPVVDGVQLNFVQGSVGWPANTRSSALPAQSIGVSIQYRYQLFTPMAALMGLVGVTQITMHDSTVMALQPGQ
jgi:hypothetical protein